MAPETLILETKSFGDTVLVERVITKLTPETEDSVAFLMITGGSAFFSKEETLAVAAQLISLTGIDSLEILELMFPNPLTRPLYTVGDMDMQAKRIRAEGASR